MTTDGAGDITRLAQGHDRHLIREARQRLQHEHEACIGQRAALETGPRHVPDELSIARLAAIRFTLEEIDAALVRLDDGTYGVCQQCRTAIAAERLEILPHARFCIRCQPATREP
jgi:DnaK suppressor protein